MKKAIRFVVFVLAFTAVTLPSFGQGAIPSNLPSTYTIQPGDTLWALSGEKLQDPLQWGKILGANPFLNQPGRVFENNGKTVVLIRPGENLLIPDGLGVKTEMVPLSALKQTPVFTQVPEARSEIPWLWILLTTLLVLSAIGVGLSQVFRNPATSGEPIIQGGIQPDDTDSVERRLQGIADNRYTAANPLADLGVTRPVRIGPIEEGRLFRFWSRRVSGSYRNAASQRRTGIPKPFPISGRPRGGVVFSPSVRQ